MEQRPNPMGNRNEGFLIMAYKNAVSEWQAFTLSDNDVATIRAVVERAFKAAGGRGELPKATSMRNVLKGEVSTDAAAFRAGNEAAPDDEAAKVAKAWAEAIAAGHAALSDLDAWPMVQKMAAAMLKPALPALPKLPSLPALPKAPAAKVGAAHGVVITRKGRAA
jgi:hypothetical protein